MPLHDIELQYKVYTVSYNTYYAANIWKIFEIARVFLSINILTESGITWTQKTGASRMVHSYAGSSFVDLMCPVNKLTIL